LESRIRHLDDLPEMPPQPCAAIDGGAAIEKSIGTDTALAIAVGLEGLTAGEAPLWDGVRHLTWQRTLEHEGEATGTACRTAMTALELAVLRTAPHPVVLLDGAHLTPIIALNAGVGMTNPALRTEIASVFELHETADALTAVMTRPEIVAIVKYDGSRDLSETWLGGAIRLDDRTTMSLLLKGGEYTEPVSLAMTQQGKRNWLAKEIAPLTPSDAIREGVRMAVNEAISLVRADAICAVYFKPHDWSTAFRLELKQSVAKSPEKLAGVLRTIQAQVVSPEIREPYPQWVADRMAKSVGDALMALRTAVHFDLADAGLTDYVALVAQSYRTEAF
jgi:hypothetical protein